MIREVYIRIEIVDVEGLYFEIVGLLFVAPRVPIGMERSDFFVHIRQNNQYNVHK